MSDFTYLNQTIQYGPIVRRFLELEHIRKIEFTVDSVEDDDYNRKADIGFTIYTSDGERYFGTEGLVATTQFVENFIRILDTIPGELSQTWKRDVQESFKFASRQLADLKAKGLIQEQEDNKPEVKRSLWYKWF